MELRRSSYL